MELSSELTADDTTELLRTANQVGPQSKGVRWLCVEGCRKAFYAAML